MKSETDEPRIKLRSAIQTDVGVVREHNEDAAVIDELADFFVVADGMGGHAAGEVASAMAVETVSGELSGVREKVRDFAKKPTDRGRKELVTILEAAVRKAHNAVYERGIREPDKQGMGTTLDVVLLAGPEAFVAHVGDSRTYLIRDGKAAQITTDHTVAEVLVIEGKLSVEEAQLSPLRTILVNAIGVAPDVGVEMAHVRLRTDDLLLLCSDGLHDYFPTEHELAEHMSGAEPKKALNAMVELAKARGGHDNITGIIVEVLDAPVDDGASPFEVDLTQPASDMSAVPEAVSSGDTLPHSLVDEAELDDDEDEDDFEEDTASGLGPAKDDDKDVPDEVDPEEHTEPSASEDLTETVRLRPLSKPPTDDEEEKDTARAKLARASTIPPEELEAAEAEAAEAEAAEAKEKDAEPEPEAEAEAEKDVPEPEAKKDDKPKKDSGKNSEPKASKKKPKSKSKKSKSKKGKKKKKKST